MVVAGNETTTKLLGNAWYWAWRNPDERAKPFADPGRRAGDWVEETLRYDTSSQMLARITTTDLTAPRRHRSRPVSGCSCWSARPTATRPCSPTPTATTSTATPATWPASASAATSAWAPPWPAWRPGSAWRSWSAGSPTYDVDPDGIERVHSVNVRGLATLPTTVTPR